MRRQRVVAGQNVGCFETSFLNVDVSPFGLQSCPLSPVASCRLPRLMMDAPWDLGSLGNYANSRGVGQVRTPLDVLIKKVEALIELSHHDILQQFYQTFAQWPQLLEFTEPECVLRLRYQK